MSMHARVSIARLEKGLAAVFELRVVEALGSRLSILLEQHAHSRLRLILALVDLRNLLVAAEHVVELLFTLRLLTSWDTSVTPAAMFRRIRSDRCLTLAMASKSLSTFAKVMRFLRA